MKASDVIRRALRLLTVLDSTEAVEAEDSADALDTLNALFAEWRGSGIPVPDYSVSGPDDDLTLDLADREAVAYKLAVRLAPEYGASLSPEAREEGEAAWRRLALRYFQPGRVDFCELPRRNHSFNIISGH